jgi:hypothetical protein
MGRGRCCFPQLGEGWLRGLFFFAARLVLVLRDEKMGCFTCPWSPVSLLSFGGAHCEEGDAMFNYAMR